MTVTNSLATAYSNQKKGLTLSTGRMVTVVGDTTTNATFLYSDDGVSWTNFSADILGWSNGSIAAYVDTGGTERIMAVWEQSGTGGGRANGNSYCIVGAFNTGRTTITWGTAIQLIDASFDENYLDVCVTPEGTGGMAFAVDSRVTATTNYPNVFRISISSAGVPTLASNDFLNGNGVTGYGVLVHCFPSIDIDLTTKRLHASWSAGTTGAGKGIRYRTASYSAGVWTWATEVEVDNTRYIQGSYYNVICRWNSNDSMVVIGALLYDAGASDLMQYESTNFTSFTTRTLIDTVTAAALTQYGSFALDGSGNSYFFGWNNSMNELGYYKWTRATTTLGSRSALDAAVASVGYVNAWFSGSTVRWIYTAGNNSPYQVKYDQLVLNVAPNTPTSLARTAPDTDTTPAFTCNITDPNTGQQVKARYTLYQSDGVTLIGTVDSALTASPATALSAEYSSALSVGSYKVTATAIDDLGLSSAASSQLSFQVTSLVSKDLTALWNVYLSAFKDLVALWNVSQSNTKDISLVWNTLILSELKTLTLLWGVHPYWENVPFETSTPTWTEVSP